MNPRRRRIRRKERKARKIVAWFKRSGVTAYVREHEAMIAGGPTWDMRPVVIRRVGRRRFALSRKHNGTACLS